MTGKSGMTVKMSTQTNHMDSEDNIDLIAKELCSIADL